MNREQILKKLKATIHINGHITGVAAGGGMTGKYAAMAPPFLWMFTLFSLEKILNCSAFFVKLILNVKVNFDRITRKGRLKLWENISEQMVFVVRQMWFLQ